MKNHDIAQATQKEVNAILAELTTFGLDVHQTNVDKGFWPEDRNIGEALALVFSEISEAYTASINGADPAYFDEKVPEYANFQVEVADAIIRLHDLCAFHDADTSPGCVVLMLNRFADEQEFYDKYAGICFAHKHIEVKRSPFLLNTDALDNMGTVLFFASVCHQYMEVNMYVANALEYHRKGEEHEPLFLMSLTNALMQAYQCLMRLIPTGDDTLIEQFWKAHKIVQAKHEYNKTRPFKHGKKY